MRVSAFININAGKKLPINPTINILFKSFACSFLNCLSAVGNNASDASKMRIAPAWLLLKLFIPIFIKINELPQINARIIKIVN